MAPLWPLTFSSGERPRALWALLFSNSFICDKVRGRTNRLTLSSKFDNAFNSFCTCFNIVVISGTDGHLLRCHLSSWKIKNWFVHLAQGASTTENPAWQMKESHDACLCTVTSCFHICASELSNVFKILPASSIHINTVRTKYHLWLRPLCAYQYIFTLIKNKLYMIYIFTVLYSE